MTSRSTSLAERSSRACDGSKNEGDTDPLAKRQQDLAKNVGYPDCLDDNAPQFVEDRTGGICLKVDVASLFESANDTRLDQPVQLSLQLANAKMGELRDLAQVKCAIRMAHQQAQDHPPGLGK